MREPKPGDWCTVEVDWPNGQTMTMEGELIMVKGEWAVVETALGPVQAPRETLEAEQRPAVVAPSNDKSKSDSSPDGTDEQT